MENSRIGRGFLMLVSVLIVIQNLVVNGFIIYPHTRLFSQGMRDCYIPIGKWFAHETSENASVAALDIGALGYYSDRKVLDLGGLITPQVHPWLKKYSPEELADRYPLLQMDLPKAEYIVLRSQQPDSIHSRFPYYEPIFVKHIASLGIQAESGNTYYTVCRIHWENVTAEAD
jgi:hypothetical protein